MIKNRKIIFRRVIIIFMVLIFILSIKIKASDEDIEYEKIVTPYTGTLKINLTNINLDDTHEYLFAISNEKGKEESEDLIFHEIENGHTSTSASIILDSSIEDIKNILKVTDTAYLYIKDKDEDTIKLSDYEINVKIPYSETFKVFQEGMKLWQIKKVYGISNLYYSTVKITDNEILKKYETLKESINENSIILNRDTETINNSNIDKMGIDFDIPTDWKSLQSPSSSYKEKEPVLPYETVPNTPDLYLIWIKAKDDDSKELYGYFLVNRLPNGGLVAKVSYNPTTNTEKEVTATITANREIKEVDGWKLSEDKTKLTKTYTNNTVETVTVMDNNNNSVQLKITVDNIIKKAENEKVSNDNTMSKSELPYTGGHIAIIFMVILTLSLVIILYFKYSKYKDI